MSDQDWNDWAVETLERRSLVEPSEPVLRRAFAIAGRRRRRALPPWLAVAAMLTVGVIGAILFTRSDRPSLPPRTDDSVVRGGEILITHPLGRQETAPELLAWDNHPHASRYSVKLYAVDDTILFEESTTASEIELPAAFVGTLHPAVTYVWTVEAFDENGAVVASSQPARFDIRP